MMPLQQGWGFGQVWIPTKDGNPNVRAIFDRHYSRRHYADDRSQKRFVGPGERIVLITPKADAICIWRKFISLDKQEGVNCAVFRNEGDQLSSYLILEAEKIARARWPWHRFYTYVDTQKIMSNNPGYCFKMAGWTTCGRTKKHKLLILEKLPDDLP